MKAAQTVGTFRWQPQLCSKMTVRLVVVYQIKCIEMFFNVIVIICHRLTNLVNMMIRLQNLLTLCEMRLLHTSLPRLMNTEKSVWGQQKMRAFLRWIVFLQQWLMGTSEFEHLSWFTFQIPINMGGLPRSLNYKLKCRWLRRTRAFEFIAEPAVTKLSPSFYRPYCSRAKPGLGWII